MTVPALALLPVLTDTDTGMGRAPGHSIPSCSSEPPATTTTTGSGPRSPQGDASARSWVRGTTRDLDTATGEILHTLDTDRMPDKVIYLPCGDRRASVWPAARTS